MRMQENKKSAIPSTCTLFFKWRHFNRKSAMYKQTTDKGGCKRCHMNGKKLESIFFQMEKRSHIIDVRYAGSIRKKVAQSVDG